MRPLRLELEGFTTFREPVAVDFSEAELFALVGPTGSGKTSLLDGMCFALYGHIPRLDRRMVEPVVSIGRNEARIRFDFSVGGTVYTAVRVVRRTARGATTKEARLESGGQVLHSEADQVTTAVEALIGLGFEQFTKSVVLPQGDFARFLHDKPKDRQELLIRLLDLGVFGEMRVRANARRTNAEAAADAAAAQRQRLEHATPEALAEATARVNGLEAALAQSEQRQAEFDDLIARQDEAERSRVDLAGRLGRLEDLDRPAGLEILLEGLATKAQRVAAAETALRKAEEAVTAAEKSLAALPAAEELTAISALHEQALNLGARIQRGAPMVQRAHEQQADASVHRREAQEAVAQAEAALTRLHQQHTALSLLSHLAVGDPCPVCQQPVAALPVVESPAELGAAEQRIVEARGQVEQAEQSLRAATAEATSHVSLMRQLEEDRAAVMETLKEHPDPETVSEQRLLVSTAQSALETARKAERAARDELRACQREADAAKKAAAGAWAAFDQARDSVAALGPPPVQREDLAAAWGDLLAWAAAERPVLDAAITKVSSEQERLLSRRSELEALLAALLTGVGLTPGEGRPRDLIADALAAERSRRERIRDDIATATQLQASEKAAREQAEISKALAGHLAANRFEQWLLDEALDQLAAGASVALRDLSGGQYSLAIDGHRQFQVIDHRNADERRSARTLSGGETFLASLALALTLAEHLSALAVSGTPRVESIFLDEGFGTLDPETLDVVAATIEELGSAGRTVGVVTHVRDLALRMPVRYEVRKTPTGSTVERIAT